MFLYQKTKPTLFVIHRLMTYNGVSRIGYYAIFKSKVKKNGFVLTCTFNELGNAFIPGFHN